MTLKMDNYDINTGDRVYDVVFDVGTVDRIVEDEGKFWVMFGVRNESYDTKGNGRFGTRTLYWKNPVIVPPHKDDDSWATTSKISKAVSIILGAKK